MLAVLFAPGCLQPARWPDSATPASAAQQGALWRGVHVSHLAELLLLGVEPLASNGKRWLDSSEPQRSLLPPARRHLLPSTLACAVWLLVAALVPCLLLALSSQKASFRIASFIVPHLSLDRQADFLPETLLRYQWNTTTAYPLDSSRAAAQTL